MDKVELLLHEIETSQLSRKIEILQDFVIQGLVSFEHQEARCREKEEHDQVLLAKESYNKLYVILALLKDIGFKASSIECETKVYKKALNYNADQSK